MRLLRRKLEKQRKKFVSIEELSRAFNIPAHMLEQWQRDGEPSRGEAEKIANYFSRELGHEILIYDLICRDLASDPFFMDVLF